MVKKLSIVTLALVLFAVSVVPTFAAVLTKYTFNDVVFSDSTLGELETSVKKTRQGYYTTCNYYSDGYVEYLGYYSDTQNVGSDSETVLNYCLEEYSNRSW